MSELSAETIIIGSGFAGLCMGIKLRQSGRDNFLILEKADDVGGTWRENTYPGAECDVPTALYSYSFEQNSDWDYRWAEQSQILHYIQTVARRHQLYDNIRFGQRLVDARFDEQNQRWTLKTATGSEYSCRYFVTAVGQLHHPQYPPIPGRENFKGRQFHSALWDHGVDLSGKRVAVIGTGASAIQFIPPVADQAAEVHVFQRSPNWILPKLDHPYTDAQKKRRQRFPLINKIDRFRTWCRGELGLWPAMKGNRLIQWVLKQMCRRNLRNTIDDSEKRRKLTPDYVVGAKRILFSDDYYQAINRDTVTLHTEPVTGFAANGVQYGEGGLAEADVIIFGTGFITNPFLSDLTVVGRQGSTLHEAWQGGAQAYLGITCSGFPNLFMMYGPNTNLGHNSIILMIEAQSKYIVQCMDLATEKNADAVEVKELVQNEYNHTLQERLAKTVWAGTDSWYTDGGRVTNNWAGSTPEYRRRTRHVNPQDYQWA